MTYAAELTARGPAPRDTARSSLRRPVPGAPPGPGARDARTLNDRHSPAPARAGRGLATLWWRYRRLPGTGWGFASGHRGAGLEARPVLLAAPRGTATWARHCPPQTAGCSRWSDPLPQHLGGAKPERPGLKSESLLLGTRSTLRRLGGERNGAWGAEEEPCFLRPGPSCSLVMVPEIHLERSLLFSLNHRKSPYADLLQHFTQDSK